MDSVLDPSIIRWVEGAASGRVVHYQRVPAGSRIGYFIDVETSPGHALELFLQRGGRGGIGSFSGFDREAEVYSALEPLGLPIPHVWGVDERLDLFLVDRAAGQAWFQAPRDPVQALAVAKAFMECLATWHRVPARHLTLPSFGPVETVRAHQLQQLAGIEKLFAAEEARRPLDLLARVQLDFLRSHVPDYDGEPVLVQGDTGPGNFLYAGDRVTAVVDWELAHLGDPMDDIAWLSWRATQHGWPDFPARLREYESISGLSIDPERVFYYRLNACARLGPGFGLADMGNAARPNEGPPGARGDVAMDRTADGSGLIMSMLHRRMRLCAQADAMGIELPGREVSEHGDVGAHAYLYDVVLDQLKGIVERVAEDRVTASLAKGAARQVKYLKEIDRHGSDFDAHELESLSRLLRKTPDSLREGRAALADAAREGRIDFEEYLLYHWNRLIRDDWLMRESSGAMYDRGWPALA